MDLRTASDLVFLFGGTAVYWLNVDRAWRDVTGTS
jgi:hypothetical protein